MKVLDWIFAIFGVVLFVYGLPCLIQERPLGYFFCSLGIVDAIVNFRNAFTQE